MCCLQVFAHTLGGAHGAQCIGILRWYEGCWRHMLFAWWVCGGHVQANCLSCGICGWDLVESLSQLAGSTPSYWDLCTQLLWAFPFLPAFSNSQVIQPSSSPYIFGMKLVWQHPIRLQKPGAHFALTFSPQKKLWAKGTSFVLSFAFSTGLLGSHTGILVCECLPNWCFYWEMRAGNFYSTIFLMSSYKSPI